MSILSQIVTSYESLDQADDFIFVLYDVVFDHVNYDFANVNLNEMVIELYPNSDSTEDEKISRKIEVKVEKLHF
jgi:hypothetical protein